MSSKLPYIAVGTAACALTLAVLMPDTPAEGEPVCIVPEKGGGFPSGIKNYPEIIRLGEIFDPARKGYPAIYDVKTGEAIIVGLDQMGSGGHDTSALFRQNNEYTGKPEFRSQGGASFTVSADYCKIGGPEGITYPRVKPGDVKFGF